MTRAVIVPLPIPEPERFTVRWVKLSGHKFNVSRHGYAVFDGDERITIPFADRAEAERHRDNIAVLYARYGWD